MDFTPQQLNEIERIVGQIKEVEKMIGKSRAKKSCITTLNKLPIEEDQRSKILELLEYDK